MHEMNTLTRVSKKKRATGPLFLGGFDRGLAELLKQFEIDGLPDGAELLFASYDLGDYEGHAFVLFKQGGKLFEVNASHCSCFGLEHQFEPEETSSESILFRLKRGGSINGCEDAEVVDKLIEILKNSL